MDKIQQMRREKIETLGMDAAILPQNTFQQERENNFKNEQSDVESEMDRNMWHCLCSVGQNVNSIVTLQLIPIFSDTKAYFQSHIHILAEGLHTESYWQKSPSSKRNT